MLAAALGATVAVAGAFWAPAMALLSDASETRRARPGAGVLDRQPGLGARPRGRAAAAAAALADATSDALALRAAGRGLRAHAVGALALAARPAPAAGYAASRRSARGVPRAAVQLEREAVLLGLGGVGGVAAAAEAAARWPA